MRIFNNVRYILASLFVLNQFPFTHIPGCAQEAAKASQDEALFVRRILEFWRDKENAIVKSQIQQFNTLYPQSEYTDSLRVILGDIYWQEKHYESALNVYNSLSKPAYRQKVFANCLDCFYHLGRYQEIAEMIPETINAQGMDLTDQQQSTLSYYQAEALLNLAKENKDAVQRAEQLEKAKAYFEQLQTSEHKINAKLGLAEIEFLNGNAEQVVQHYIDLAQEAPEKKEDMLLRAAQLQAQYDPELALEELEKIQEVYGAYSSQAALTRLSILYDTQRYQQIIDENPRFFKVLKTSQQPILTLYLGRSYFYLNQYESALQEFQRLQRPEHKLPYNDPNIEKSIFVMMAACAYQVHDLALASALKEKFQAEFPGDPAEAKLLYYEALALVYHQKYSQALENFDRILSKYPQEELFRDVLYEKSLVLFAQGRWLESRKSFAELIQQASDSRLYASAIQYMPYLSMQLLEEAEQQGGDEVNQWRHALLADLQRVLKDTEAGSNIQRAKYTLQLGKVLYDLKSYTEAIETLQAYIDKYPEDENRYQAHLLLALCYQDGPHDLGLFAKHAETVLQIKPDYADKTRLHMNLFNAYLDLAKSPESQANYYDLAANHLYQAVQDPKANIKMENQLWLGNYFYHQVRDSVSDHDIEFLKDAELVTSAEKSLAVYMNVLRPIEIVKFDPDNAYLETEYFKLSNLLGWLNHLQEQRILLTQLIKVQNDPTDIKWKLRARTLFAYANVSLALNETKDAQDTYRELFESKTADAYVSNAAKLRWARLAYASLSAEKKNTDDPEMLTLLKTLKDVQIHKILMQEPIHLEASIDYVAIRSSLEPLEKQEEQQLFLFKRIRDDFTGKDDIWSKDYAEARRAHPDKNALVEAYLNLVEAHIQHLEGAIAKKNNTAGYAEKLESAQKSYQQLLADTSYSNHYIRQQAEAGLKQIVLP